MNSKEIKKLKFNPNGGYLVATNVDGDKYFVAYRKDPVLMDILFCKGVKFAGVQPEDFNLGRTTALISDFAIPLKSLVGIDFVEELFFNTIVKDILNTNFLNQIKATTKSFLEVAE